MLNSEREKLVVDLYKNQNKSIREIAQEARMSFRDIGAILKKAVDVNNGNAIDDGKDNNNNNNNKSTNVKATQAYELFDKADFLGNLLSDLATNIREKSMDEKVSVVTTGLLPGAYDGIISAIIKWEYKIGNNFWTFSLCHVIL